MQLTINKRIKGFKLLKLAGFIAGFLSLASCQTTTHTQALIAKPPANLAKQHLIEDVPFYPIADYFSGPAALAEIANYYGLRQSPTALTRRFFSQNEQSPFQADLTSAASQIGLVAYTQAGTLTQLVQLVAEDIPVIVLQNNGLELFPDWQYAMVVGYDLAEQSITLNTGTVEHLKLNLVEFEQSWARGQYWMLAGLSAAKSSQYLDSAIYTNAAQTLLDIKLDEVGSQALKTAIKQWPEQWQAYLLLANYQVKQSPHQALELYNKVFEQAKNESDYLSYYAYALGKANCYNEAFTMIEQAIKLQPQDTALLATQSELKHLEEDAVLIQQCPKHDVFSLIY